MASTPLSEIISIGDLAWQERQPGVRMKAIWEHAESRRKAVLTRIEPDAKLPLHRHVGDELVFVIEGAIGDEFGTVTAGNVGYRPDGCVHTVSSTNGATVLAIITGGVEPATGRGDAPPSRIFNLSELPWIDARPGVRQKRIWERGRGYGRQRPDQRGWRFSRKARAPSSRSSVVRRKVERSPSRRSPSVSDMASPLTTASLA
jgi:mannose-6-phosphate isomerase-like protein (cupin superfamily)